METMLLQGEGVLMATGNLAPGDPALPSVPSK